MQKSEIGFAEQDSCENKAFGNLENGIWKSGILKSENIKIAKNIRASRMMRIDPSRQGSMTEHVFSL